jgi:hypothetical protein
VLVMRDQRMDTDEFMRAAEVFGEIMPHHRMSGNTVENPRVSRPASISSRASPFTPTIPTTRSRPRPPRFFRYRYRAVAATRSSSTCISHMMNCRRR